MKQNVVSREYKVMLKRENFVGSPDNLIEQAKDFWIAFKNSIQDIVIDTDGSLDTLKAQRTVRFYDTTDRFLRQNNYVLRERINIDTEKCEVTLKFRHPDRYISQDRNMDAADIDLGKKKFEEDIKLPFIKLYSFSTTQPISDKNTLSRLADLPMLYPDIKNRLTPFQHNAQIGIVNDFTAREVIITGADFQIKKNPKVEAKCTVVAWYDNEGAEDFPVCVEFSFKYKSKEEEYDGESAQRAYHVFSKLLHNDMAEKWVDANGTTKTAYVYSENKGGTF